MPSRDRLCLGPAQLPIGEVQLALLQAASIKVSFLLAVMNENTYATYINFLELKLAQQS
jgi:hypothetical protein